MRKSRRTRRPRPISNWRDGWKMSCVQAAALLTLLNALDAEILPLFNFAIPPGYMNWCNAILGLGIIVLRLVLQPPLAAGPEKQEPPA